MINWETNSSNMSLADLKHFEEEIKNVNTTEYPEFKTIREQMKLKIHQSLLTQVNETLVKNDFRENDIALVLSLMKDAFSDRDDEAKRNVLYSSLVEKANNQLKSYINNGDFDKENSMFDELNHHSEISNQFNEAKPRILDKLISSATEDVSLIEIKVASADLLEQQRKKNEEAQKLAEQAKQKKEIAIKNGDIYIGMTTNEVVAAWGNTQLLKHGWLVKGKVLQTWDYEVTKNNNINISGYFKTLTFYDGILTKIEPDSLGPEWKARSLAQKK
jgi:hypothetical protein